MSRNFFVPISEAVEKLNQQVLQPFVVMMKNENMSVEYFAPKNIDTQTPHLQNELYVITSGNSQFYREGEIINCTKGDVIFVSAAMEHRFLNFTDDFATWVIFYGDEKKAS